jgi:hypothetical protein
MALLQLLYLKMSTYVENLLICAPLNDNHAFNVPNNNFKATNC